MKINLSEKLNTLKFKFMLCLILIPVMVLPIFMRTRWHLPPETWSLLQAGTLIMIYLYPKWRVFVAMLFVTTLIIYKFEHIIPSADIAMHSTLTNGFLLFFVTYYRIQSYKTMEKLKELSYRDPLTNLYNRRFFDNYVTKNLSELRKRYAEYTIIICDIDHFKKINDMYGHLHGDHVIKMTASILDGFLRSDDVLIRFGGEEFLILLPDTSADKGYSLAEIIRQTMEKQEIRYMDEVIHVTMSFGIASYSGNPSSNRVIDEADKALYHAKESGRNKVCVYSNDTTFGQLFQIN